MRDINFVKKTLEESVWAFKENREENLKARNFFHGSQLTPQQIHKLKVDRKPVVIENRIAMFTSIILAHIQNRETHVKIFGQSERGKKIAQNLNEMLFVVRENSQTDRELEWSNLDLLLDGFAVQRVGVKYYNKRDKFGRYIKDIVIDRIPSEDILLDPNFREFDYRDGKYIHVVFRVPRFELKEHFDTELVNSLSILSNHYTNLSTLGKYAMWNKIDYQSDLVDVVESWYLDYDVDTKKTEAYFMLWSNNTVLEHFRSPYSEFLGSRFPFAVSVANRDIGTSYYGTFYNRIYGAFKNIIPLQDNLNFLSLRLNRLLGVHKPVLGDIAGIIADNPDWSLQKFTSDYTSDDKIAHIPDLSQYRQDELRPLVDELIRARQDVRNAMDQLLNLNTEMLGKANHRMSAVGIEKRKELSLSGLGIYINRIDQLQIDLTDITIHFIQYYFNFSNTYVYTDNKASVRELSINENFGDDLNGEVKFTYRAVPKPLTTDSEKYERGLELIRLISGIPNLQPVLEDIAPELIQLAEFDITGDTVDKIKEIIKANRENGSAMEMQKMQAEEQRKNALVQADIGLKVSKSQESLAKKAKLEEENETQLTKELIKKGL